MKKKLSFLGAVILMCLIVIPVSASALSPTAYVGSKYSHSFDGTTLTVQVFAGDVNNQPAASGPTLVQITYGFPTSPPTNWVTHTIPMSLVSSSPSTGWYTYTVNPPTGSTVGVIEVKFPNHVIGGNVWYPVP